MLPDHAPIADQASSLKIRSVQLVARVSNLFPSRKKSLRADESAESGAVDNKPVSRGAYRGTHSPID